MLPKKIDKIVKLLESLKKQQFSKYIEWINQQILNYIKSTYVNPRMARYFKTMNTTGVPFTDFSLDPDNISQIKKLVNCLYHSRLAFLNLENINVRESPQRAMSDVWQLLTKTAHEGYQACYLLTHLDIDLKEMFRDELDLLLPMINHINSFTKEYANDDRAINEPEQISISDIWNKITGKPSENPGPKPISSTLGKVTKEFTETLQTIPLSNTLGKISGTTIEKMQPDSADVDFKFLTQFSADLPGYIEQLTNYIKTFTSEPGSDTPSLNDENLEKLQLLALKLLNDLESHQENKLFRSLEYLNLIYNGRSVITLAQESLAQMMHLSHSTQDVIRDHLAKLKYDLLPSLFGLIDTIEENAMLKPGTLSNPLMQKIKPLYALLIYYAKKPVNFKEKGEELLEIEDSRFLALRLERTYKRINDSNKQLIKIERAQKAFEQFYQTLNMLQDKNQTISQLSPEMRLQLIGYYKLIKPYMMQIDFDLNDQLIDSFNGGLSTMQSLGKTWTSFINTPWTVLPGKLYNWSTSKLPADHLSFVLAHKDTLQTLFAKKRATAQFHIDLNMDLINSVNQNSELVLFPCYEKNNVFAIDEEKILNPETPGKSSELHYKRDKKDNLLMNPELLTSDQALELHLYYKNKRDKFLLAQNAYQEMSNLLKSLNINKLHTNNLTPQTKLKLRNLYSLFQPYFIHGVQSIEGIPEQQKKEAVEFDKNLADLLSDPKEKPEGYTAPQPDHNILNKLDQYFQVFFTDNDLNWGRKSQHYLKLAHEKSIQEHEATPLEQDARIGERGHHVFQHKDYSKLIYEFRQSLQNRILPLFNNSMQAQLRLPSNLNVLPFPEVENENKLRAQSKQVIAIKRIFNCVYHLEAIMYHLEELDNRTPELIYVGYLIAAYTHIYEIQDLHIKFTNDPHLRLITKDLIDKAQYILATIQSHSDAYQVSAEEVAYDSTVEYSAIWYSVNAFFIGPKHLRSLSNTNYLTVEELDELQIKAKKSTVIIENLIRHSGHYFQLFLQTPNMLFLYTEMKAKLNEFISTSHDTVMNNLDQFRTKIFTPMLLEADQWEDKLGLKPGILSGPLRQITDEYYKGMLHSLKLNAKEHIPLVCNSSSTEQRVAKTTAKIENISRHLEKLEQNYQHVNALYVLFKDFKSLANQPFATPLLELKMNGELSGGPLSNFKITKEQLIDAYKKAMPKLARLQKKVIISLHTNDYEKEFDAMLNSELKEYEPKISRIMAYVSSSHKYYLGLKATYTTHLNTANEKLAYLNELKQAHEPENLRFIEEYTTESFEKKMKTLCNRHIGLQYTDKEYRTKLSEYLLTFKADIISQAKTIDDINLTVDNLLKEKVKLFEERHYVEYYHLDSVRVALAQFKNYFSLVAIGQQNSLFENEKTLSAKTKKINKLVDITEDTQLGINERLNLIKKQVESPRFKRIILAHKQADHFSLTYLIQCIASLLETLRLYKPARTKHYSKLTENTTTEPKMSELSTRFGLFATESRPTAPSLSPIDSSTESPKPSPG